MQSASAMLYSSSPEDAIRRLRSGETQVREVLIQDNWKYISATVSKMIGNQLNQQMNSALPYKPLTKQLITMTKQRIPIFYLSQI